MVVVSGVHLGTDKKLHDAFTPTDIVARVGQKVVVTVYNYDQGSHSFTAPTLHLNVVFPAATRAGVPTVTTFSFTTTPRKAGRWHTPATWRAPLRSSGGSGIGCGVRGS